MNILTTLQLPLGQDSIYYVNLNSKPIDMLSKKMHISFIRPLLEYSDAVWDKQLEAVHNEAARIITGATKLCSINNLLADLGWETLQARRARHKLVILYKIINGLAPEYLQTLVPPIVQNTTSYNLRNSNDLRNVHAGTNPFF